MIAVIILLVVVAVLVLWFFGAYNGLIKLRNLVQEAWAQIDVELKRRHDLIGNLVETVKGYAAHERGTLEAVTQARAAAMAPGQSPAQAARAEVALTQALVRLNAVSEAYPDLKANQNFSALQAELGATEDRIASARRYYNANVRELNTKVESIPTNFVAGIASVTKAEYFELESAVEREAPKVSFDPAPAQPQLPPAAATPPPIQDAPAPGAGATGPSPWPQQPPAPPSA
jgi:LemA protein